MRVDGQCYAPADLTPGKRNGTYCIGGCVGRRGYLGSCGKSRPHRNSIPELPARSESLYQLSYPGPRTEQAHIHVVLSDKKRIRENELERKIRRGIMWNSLLAICEWTYASHGNQWEQSVRRSKYRNREPPGYYSDALLPLPGFSLRKWDLYPWFPFRAISSSVLLPHSMIALLYESLSTLRFT